MSELMTAREYSNIVLQRTKEFIAAKKIQKTWRSLKIEEMAQVERARAQMNKVENLLLFGPSWKNKESSQIKDLLEGMENVKGTHLLTFGEECEARANNGNTYKEAMHGEDGIEKSTTKFTSLVNSWTYYCGEKGEFFNGVAKVWADDPSSVDWIEYFHRVILLLEENVPVKLWGERGGYKNLGRGDKKLINDLKDYWILHQVKKEIMKLQAELKNPVKECPMNPLAEEFIPEVLYAYHA